MNESSASISRPAIVRTDSGNGSTTEKAKLPAGLPVQRTTRYKEKFLTMKERYEVVTAAHEKYEKELAIANEKIKRLQNECNLLLDAVDIAVPGQPTLLQYLAADPIPSHYLMMSAPQFDGIPPPPPAEQLSAPQAPSRTHSQNSAPQTNGTNGHI